MATERRKVLRRPMRRLILNKQKKPAYRPKGKMGLVPPGTRGIYDRNPNVRAATARAMVARRQMIEVVCQAEGCVDPSTGEPRRFMSRLVDGEPERKGCSSAHRLKIWRARMREQGYRQTQVDGVFGWLTPDGIFYPNPTQPAKRDRSVAGMLARKQERRFNRVRRRATTEVSPGSE